MAVQSGLWRTWSKTPNTGFLATMLILFMPPCKNTKHKRKLAYADTETSKVLDILDIRTSGIIQAGHQIANTDLFR